MFTLRLPLADAAVAAVPAAGALGRDAARGAPSRILVVDDNVGAAETLGLLLEELGHVTSVVTEARQALAAALAFTPDVVFLDLGMPHLNGFDLARQMRAHPALGEVRLVALSGWGTDHDRARSRDAGIDRHLTKPVLIDEVGSMLDR